MKGDPVDHPPDGLKSRTWGSRSAFDAILPIPAEMIWIVCIKMQQPEVFLWFNIQVVWFFHLFCSGSAPLKFKTV